MWRKELDSSITLIQVYLNISWRNLKLNISSFYWNVFLNTYILYLALDTEAKQNGNKVTSTWKFLTGVIMIILCTSMVIVCAVKSPTWYKMLFDYRHQRLREAEEPSIFSPGRYSNFSLNTEQTETSAHELDQDLAEMPEDEDGFIEDGYIQPEDYKEHVDVDEV